MISPDDIEDFIELKNELRDRVDEIIVELKYPPSACLAVFLQAAAYIHVICKGERADLNSYLSICEHFYRQAEIVVDSISED